ncbi:MAG: hypothetical protein EOR67_21030 [Mesorhizobium sp.]|uniref:hypothetical protein n=1 Tax=Mesorhizobium sp. TaxID=1871066 RepID=UPI000FE82A5A|nr:hypothetical protein [Mesorhizobium sp.]RWL80297.1 MAG: hypothetical protein EOR69_22630 [Mesorhizobium sp.]RWL85920.1 MAG: hypothetical protein EOR67_21030 [Mesorhizobium sp.]RWL93129.1 MAG: hypothetical protein EOR70_29410 [Mesorhizobium sp.]
MRRVWLTAFAMLIGVADSFAEEVVKAVFLPGTAGEPAKVVFTDTKMVAAVVDAINGQPPTDCPDGSFWTKGPNSLVSCKDGATFKLSPLVPSDKYYDLFAGRDALKLLKVKGGTETDENPPMRSEQKKGVKP